MANNSIPKSKVSALYLKNLQPKKKKKKGATIIRHCIEQWTLTNHVLDFRRRHFLSFLDLCLFIFFFLFFLTLSAQTVLESSNSTSPTSSSANLSNPVEKTGFKQYPNGKLGKNGNGWMGSTSASLVGPERGIGLFA